MERLPPGLDPFLYDTNPWWERKPGPVQPPYRRWAFHTTLKKLKSGLAPVVTLCGARQVGKTTLQQQLIRHFLSDGGVEPRRVLRIQFDDIPSVRGLNEPILSIARYNRNPASPEGQHWLAADLELPEVP